MSAPTHVTQSAGDRRKSREQAEARQSGTMAPEVDIKTGSIINPHNPEFITKRPWYLGGGEEGPSLDHQGNQKAADEKLELSLAAADAIVKEERRKLREQQRTGSFQVGTWVEAMKKNRMPYRICQIVAMQKKGTEFDLKFEDGTVEKKVKLKQRMGANKPRIRMTKTGTRSVKIDAATFGKETYDSKRDRYHGYDVQEGHLKELQEKFTKKDELRRKMRAKENDEGENTKEDDAEKEKMQKGRNSDSDSDYDSDEGSDSDDEFRQMDEDDKMFTSRLARQGGVGGAQMKVTARNLRIREDTAKYLRNLDPNSAYYDPKSRSMRDNPNPEVSAEELQFAGDNFARISGDAVNLAEAQLFAWDAQGKGVGEIHPQANPSQVELLKKQFKTKSFDLKAQRKKAVLDKYGGSEYLDGAGGLAGDSNNDHTETRNNSIAAAERKARFGVSVAAEEYTRDGRLIQGGVAAKRVALKSKYEEDVFINSHTTVWGSYFHRGAFHWGYADDHALIKNSYCTGANGRKANDEANELRYGTGVAGSAALAQAREMLKVIPTGERTSTLTSSEPMNRSKHYGEADQKVILDKTKVEEALKNADREALQHGSERKRKFNSTNAEVNVTEEEMEAYRMRKGRGDDPMTKLSSEEVLDYK